MTTSCFLTVLLLLPCIHSENGTVKIRFFGESSRAVRDPKESKSFISRRNFNAPQETLCHTVGFTVGALMAYRMTSYGTLSHGEVFSDHTLVDLRGFISLMATSVTQDLDDLTGCPQTVLQSAAEEMCLEVVCTSNGLPVPRDSCLKHAFQRSGILKDDFRSYFPKQLMTCVNQYFNIRATNFYDDPQKKLLELVKGLPGEVVQLQKALQVINVKPINLEFTASLVEINYLVTAVRGAVISAHVGKIILQNGNITDSPDYGQLDANIFLSYIIGRIIRKLNINPILMALRAHTLAFKMAMYWLINNRELLLASPPSLITMNTLDNLGLADYFPPVFRLSMNNAPVVSNKLFIAFPGSPDTLEAKSAILERKINISQLQLEIEVLLPKEPFSVPEEVIKLQLEPLESHKGQLFKFQNSNPLMETHEAIGALPRPEDWFSADAPVRNTSKKLNAAMMGTLAVMTGAHASTLLSQVGLVTRQGEPGYRNLSRINVYPVIQNIVKEFVNKLATVIPMTLDQAFYILNGAFKTTKLMLQIGDGKSLPLSTLIPLGLKHYNLLQFYPHLQHVDWDLWPLPSQFKVIYLWVKPMFNVSIDQAIHIRMENASRLQFPKLLSDIVGVFRHYEHSISIYNLKTLPEKVDNILSWDPPDALSLLYEPSTNDGVPFSSPTSEDAPRVPLTCPGHIFCSPDHCSSPPCGYYTCTSQDPWCYFPPGIKCPGSISCPVEVQIQGKKLICPEQNDCPIVSIQCPGRYECPDEITTCPGAANCPLQIKCPGALCPQRFVTRPQTLLPCPEHRLCAHQPVPEQLVCSDDVSCSYTSYSPSDVAEAIKEAGKAVSNSLDRKKLTVSVNNTAAAYITLDEQKVASSASGTILHNSKAAAASAAATSKGGQKPTPTLNTECNDCNKF